MTYFFSFNNKFYIYRRICFKKSFEWGLGIGDWGLGIGDWAQSPIPNPQSPIPNPQSPYLEFLGIKNIKINIIYII